MSMLSWEDDRNDSMRLDVNKRGFALLVRYSGNDAEYWIDDTGERYERANEIEVVSPIFVYSEYAARWLHKNIASVLKKEDGNGKRVTYSNGAGSWEMSAYAAKRIADADKRAAKKTTRAK